MKPQTPISTVYVPSGFTNGIEGPACDAAGNLYAVNYLRQGTIGCVRPDGHAEIFLELPKGSIGNGIRFDSSGRMLIADYSGHNILQVEMQSKAICVLAHEPRMNQPNDIAVTARDRVFCSDPNWANNTGNLWRVDPDGTVTLLEADMGTTNGIEVSSDERTLYVNESVQRRIWAYDLGQDGSVGNKRLLLEFADFGLDGMRCDLEGNLFVTRYGKGTIAKVSPHGEVLDEIALHGRCPTNLAFGGADGRTIYVTIQDNGSLEQFRVTTAGREWHLQQKI